MYIEVAEKNLDKVFDIARKNGDIELAKIAAAISMALWLAKYEERGLVCSKCGLGTNDKMAVVTQGMCQCNH